MPAGVDVQALPFFSALHIVYTFIWCSFFNPFSHTIYLFHLEKEKVLENAPTRTFNFMIRIIDDGIYF